MTTSSQPEVRAIASSSRRSISDSFSSAVIAAMSHLSASVGGSPHRTVLGTFCPARRSSDISRKPATAQGAPIRPRVAKSRTRAWQNPMSLAVVDPPPGCHSAAGWAAGAKLIVPAAHHVSVLLVDVRRFHHLRGTPYREFLAVIEVVVGNLFEQWILRRFLSQHLHPRLLYGSQIVVAPTFHLHAMLRLV